MAARTQPVVPFALPLTRENADVHQALDILVEALGRVSSLVVVCLALDTSGGTIVADGSVGTVLAGSTTALDFQDAKLDTFRVVAYVSADQAGGVVVVRDVVADRELCRVAIPTSPALMTGEWTTLPVALSGERRIEARVIGNGAASQTVVNVHLHARTTHFR